MVCWLLALPLIGAATIGLLAQWIDPRSVWWPQLFAVVLPFLGFGLAATAIFAVLLRVYRLGAVLLVLALIVGVRAEPWARFGGASGEGDALRLITFNVPERLAPEAMRDSMAAFVERETPDIIAVQDAWVRGPRRRRPAWQAPQIRGVVDNLEYDLVVPSLLPGVGGWKRDATGVPLLVRQGGPRVLEQEAIVISDPRDNKASQAIRSTVEWEGRSFVLYDLHLRSFGDAKPWLDSDFVLTRPSTWGASLSRLATVYRQRAVDTDRIVAAIEAETLPVVIAGDFNSTADNWSYRQLRRAGGVARADAFREAGQSLWGRTFHSETLLVRIDHVLVDPALTVERAEVRNVGFSDHRPVLVRLLWRSE
ncbi:MAG: endonuclease/exonuclease/phosphatase family protein [Bacteroidota bacterium]